MSRYSVAVVFLFLFLWVSLYGRSGEIHFLIAGDIFPSPSLIEGGIQTNGSRDYSDYYRYVRKKITEADVACSWLGGPVAGEGEAYSGYPTYNDPPEFILAGGKAGFDIFFHTNHLLDHGLEGLFRTLEFYKTNGLRQLGVHSSEKDRDNFCYISTNGLKVCVLSYLYAANGYTAPQSWMVNWIDTNRIRLDIEKAKLEGADFVVVGIHWGTEYRREPDRSQKRLAKRMADWGADLILGSHPHVMQPCDVIQAKRADGSVKPVFVIYSIGNYLSSQRGRYSDCGLMLSFTVARETDGRVSARDFTYTPTWVLYRKTGSVPSYEISVLPSREWTIRYETGETNLLTPDEYRKLKLSLDDTVLMMENTNIPLLEARQH